MECIMQSIRNILWVQISQIVQNKNPRRIKYLYRNVISFENILQIFTKILLVLIEKKNSVKYSKWMKSVVN